MDPARADPVRSALSFVHPAIAALGLLLAIAALQVGLRLREARLRHRPDPPPLAQRHERLGPWSVALVALAFVLGPLSSALLRGWPLLRTVHGWASAASLMLFAASAAAGRRAQAEARAGKAGPGPRGAHGKLGLLAMLAAAVAAITGIELLP